MSQEDIIETLRAENAGLTVQVEQLTESLAKMVKSGKLQQKTIAELIDALGSILDKESISSAEMESKLEVQH